MADSTSQVETTTTVSALAKTLAPEDVRVGDYVSPLFETYDYPSFLWNHDEALSERSQTVCIEYLAIGRAEPLKVLAICLPFVLVKSARNVTETLDVRRLKLAKLDPEYAELAWKEYKPRNEKQKKKK